MRCKETCFALIFIMSFAGYDSDILRFINPIYKTVCFINPSAV